MATLRAVTTPGFASAEGHGASAAGSGRPDRPNRTQAPPGRSVDVACAPTAGRASGVDGVSTVVRGSAWSSEVVAGAPRIGPSDAEPTGRTSSLPGSGSTVP